MPCIWPDHLRFKIIGGDTDSLMLKADGPLLEQLYALSDSPMQQFETLYQAMACIASLVNMQLPGMQFNIKRLYTLFYYMGKGRYAALPFLSGMIDEGTKPTINPAPGEASPSPAATTSQAQTQSRWTVQPVAFSISDLVVRGIHPLQMGVAPFVRQARLRLVLDVMTLSMHTRPSAPLTMTDRNYSHAGAATGTSMSDVDQTLPGSIVVVNPTHVAQTTSRVPLTVRAITRKTKDSRKLCIEELEQRVDALLQTLLQLFRPGRESPTAIILDSLIITNRLDKPLSTLLFERACKPEGVVSFAPHEKAAFTEDDFSEAAQHPVRGDSIDYIICHDFTTSKGWRAKPVPEACGQRPHMEWYMRQNVCNALLEVLEPMGYMTRVQLSAKFDRMIFDVDNAQQDVE